jgi:hypothetical protein
LIILCNIIYEQLAFNNTQQVKIDTTTWKWRSVNNKPTFKYRVITDPAVNVFEGKNFETAISVDVDIDASFSIDFPDLVILPEGYIDPSLNTRLDGVVHNRYTNILTVRLKNIGSGTAFGATDILGAGTGVTRIAHKMLINGNNIDKNNTPMILIPSSHTTADMGVSGGYFYHSDLSAGDIETFKFDVASWNIHADERINLSIELDKMGIVRELNNFTLHKVDELIFP